MPNNVGTKLATMERCLSCDGLVDRPPFSGKRAHEWKRRPHQRCPECGGNVFHCLKCDLWLASSWYRQPASKHCNFCLGQIKKDRPWAPAEGRRLSEASSPILNFWARYHDEWTDDDLVVWREFLSAVERIKGLGDKDADEA